MFKTVLLSADPYDPRNVGPWEAVTEDDNIIQVSREEYIKIWESTEEPIF